MRDIDYMAKVAAQDNLKLEKFIEQNEFFIIKCASGVVNRYITKSDDEWSVALIAFEEAIRSYQMDKGSFFSFAKLIITRRLVDYYRVKVRISTELTVDPHLFSTEPEFEEENFSLRTQIAQKIAVSPDDSLKLEIEGVSILFKEYGFSFMELANCSPHAVKTKEACAKIIRYLLENELVFEQVKSTKKLPVKIIEKNCKVPRKLIERHRKYIIAATEILSGEYPGLSTYLSYIREEK